MKKYILALTLFLVIILSSCSSSKETIKIGFISTLTGRYAEVGINTMYGAQMALDEINSNGGVNGRNLELLIRDDEADPQIAVSMQNELKALGCNVIIGHSLSLVAIEAVANANSQDILLVSPSIGTDLLTGIDDNLIRLVTTVYYESTAISEFMLDSSPNKVMIIVNDDNIVLTQYHLNAFTTFFTAEGYSENNQIVGRFYSDNSSQIESIKNSILTEEPDSIMIVSSNTDAAPFVNYIKGLDLDIDIHLTSWAGTSIINRIDSVDTSDIYLYNDFITPTNSAEYQEYKTAFIDKYSQNPDMLSTNGYDAVYMIYSALDNGAEYTADAMKASILSNTSYEGINDTFGIDQYGDNLREVLQYTIVDGDLVPVN